jgi:hypothetical protein
MVDQVTLASKSTTSLPEWWGVHDALICANVREDLRSACLHSAAESSRDPALVTAHKQLLDVLQKRSTAASKLRNAYQAFINLATYDAGAETQAAISGAFSAVDDLTKAAAAFNPALAALTPLSGTAETVISNVGGIIAAERQRHELLKASRALHAATDRMVIALTAEADAPAMKVLMAELIAERTAVYLAFVRAGLVSSSDALAPVVGDVAAPGTVVQSNPSASSDVVQAAATASIRIRAKNEEAGVLASCLGRRVRNPGPVSAN